MKKKITIFIVLATGILCLLTACTTTTVNQQNSSSSTTSSASVTTTVKPQTTEPQTTQPPTTVKKNLSDECDKVLATGTDDEGNFYELVANEYEDYTGTTIEMGVIKNNEWSIPMTTNCPFIGEHGMLISYSDSAQPWQGSIYTYGNYATINISYHTWYDFSYIGNGCFHYDYCIWNGNNGASYVSDFHSLHPQVRIILSNGQKVAYCNEDGKVLLIDSGSNFYILDTTTMEKSETSLKVPAYPADYTLPISENLFYAGRTASNLTKGFYDLEGNLVIDLSKYDLEDATDWVFKNGQCTITIKNDQGTLYKLVIDKTGEVIDSWPA